MDRGARPRVAFVRTGGTIEMLGVDRLDMAWYGDRRRFMPDGELLARLPELAGVAELVEVPFRRLQSNAVTSADWLDLLRRLHAALADETVAGAVVTHGTNTLEETAYFLHLALETSKPVVLVGAMRPPSGLSPDGDANLLHAVTVAATPAARGLGALVVMDGAILCGRDVTKTSTYALDAVRDPAHGPLGIVDADGSVVLYRHPVRPHTERCELRVDGLEELPRVDVVASYAGADGALIDAAVAAGARGIVSAGTGAAFVTPGEDAALERAVQRGVVVCRGSRTGTGRLPRTPAMVERGMVASDDLSAWKARVLLALALTRTSEPAEVQRMMDTY